MIYVMSDIHGNIAKFDSVMRQIKLKPDDTLYVLGDVIDRYPSGIKILKKLMEMPNVKMLLGNHEHMMIQALRFPYAADKQVKRSEHRGNLSIWYQNGGDITHRCLKHYTHEFRDKMFDYLESLPLHYDLELNGTTYKLVHAAPIELFEELNWKYDDEQQFAVWERLSPGYKLPKEYVLIFGHTPTAYFQDDDILKIWYGEGRIGIDCGSGFPASRYAPENYGRLACLRLDDMKEFYSEAIDVP